MTNQKPQSNNIFGSVLTYEGPSSNYRQGTEGNLNVLQKLRYADGEHTIFSAEAIRNRLRDMLREDRLPANRTRLNSQGQLTVRYEDYPNPLRYFDDKLFGFLALGKRGDLKNLIKKINYADFQQLDSQLIEKTRLVLEALDLTDEKKKLFPEQPKETGASRKKKAKEEVQATEESDVASPQESSQDNMAELEKKLRALVEFAEFQGDSVLRLNYAVSLKPFKHNATMHQSPMITGAFSNAKTSVLSQREVHVSDYQYPFGMNLNDLRIPDRWNLEESEKRQKEQEAQRWVAGLLRAIGDLGGVAGNQARTMFFFSPASIVLRFTTRRTPDFDVYGFRDGHRELLDDLLHDRLPRQEFYLGGRIVKYMDADLKSALQQESNSVHLFEVSHKAIEKLIEDAGLEPDESQSNQVE
jgi:hypothetical protein